MLKILKNIKINPLLAEISQIAGFLRNKGWAEANAGNFSINITDIFDIHAPDFADSGGIKLKKTYKSLTGNYILISRSESRMRDIAENPVPELCLLYIDISGNLYYNIPLDNIKTKIPSSELPSHLEIQNLLSEKKRKEKVVLHTHPAEIIALTHLKNYCNEKNINKLIFSVQPEVTLLFPEGVGFVPYMLTGSEKLAVETGKKFKKHKTVIWEKHGCISIGENMNDAFDKIDIINKSINIFLMCSSTGNKPDGLNVYQVKELKHPNKK